MKLRILSFGEVLWDVIEGQEFIGGAPFNLAAHAAHLGCESWLISRIGKDERGLAAVDKIKKAGIKTDLIQEDIFHPTGWVDVMLSDNGIPSYTLHEHVAYDYIKWNDFLKGTLKKCILMRSASEL